MSATSVLVPDVWPKSECVGVIYGTLSLALGDGECVRKRCLHLFANFLDLIGFNPSFDPISCPSSSTLS